MAIHHQVFYRLSQHLLRTQTISNVQLGSQEVHLAQMVGIEREQYHMVEYRQVDMRLDPGMQECLFRQRLLLGSFRLLNHRTTNHTALSHRYQEDNFLSNNQHPQELNESMLFGLKLD